MKKSLLSLSFLLLATSVNASYVIMVERNNNDYVLSTDTTGQQDVEVGDWLDDPIGHYSCLAWSTMPSDTDYGADYVVERDCSQDQTQTTNTYDILINGNKVLVDTTIEERTITEIETQTLTRQLYVDTNNLSGNTYANSYQDLSNQYINSNFTMEAWIKPHKAIKTTSVASNVGIDGVIDENYLFYPVHGGDGTSRHGLGLSVGTNGIKVFVHSGGYMPALFVRYQSFSSSSWTHVAVSVINNVPYVYVNGSLLGIGYAPINNETAFSTYAVGTDNSYGAFYGEVAIARIWNGALSDSQMAANYNKYISVNTVIGSSTLLEIKDQTEPEDE